MSGLPSPAERVEAAKRDRDIAGEIGALVQGHAHLESASWHPAQPGDLVHVGYSAMGERSPAWGETYEVTNELSLRLIHHTAPKGAFVGAYAPGLVGDPLMEVWMEAGPHNVTVIRQGRCVYPEPRPS